MDTASRPAGPGRPLRALVCVERPELVASGRLCARCSAVIDAGPVLEMRRPGSRRGVVWCGNCAAPYREVEP